MNMIPTSRIIPAACAGFLLAAGSLLAVGSHAEEGVPEIAGIYEMEGLTEVEGSVDRFVLSGKLVIKQEGANCETSVHGEYKRIKGKSGPAQFAMHGTGEVTLEGRNFRGVSEVQTIISDVPGMDVNAPMMPKKYGPKLRSRSTGKVLEDGTLEFQLRTEVIGEGFTLPEGRKTTVRARRIARSPFEPKTKPLQD